MATPTNHWKLGMFVVVAVLIGMGVAVYLGAHTLTKETVSYVAYFDESVQGLELGSPVKFRGVTIGRVSVIDIASDGRHVQATLEVLVQQLERLSLDKLSGAHTRLFVDPELRVQLTSAGLTGVKFLLIDFFDPKSNPRPKLPFKVPGNYIPTAPSTMKNIEDSLVRTAHSFPEVAANLLLTLDKVNGILDSITEQRIPEKALGTLEQTTRSMNELEQQLAALNAGKLSQQTQVNLTNLNATLTKMNSVLDQVQSERGLLASAIRTSNAMGEVARNANTLGPQTQDTLREIRGAAQAIRKFANALERDPDMLIKGRAQVAHEP
jgi:phospholipid/cholesterol/gamma-HCH transport system substrate-binding protein